MLRFGFIVLLLICVGAATAVRFRPLWFEPDDNCFGVTTRELCLSFQGDPRDRRSLCMWCRVSPYAHNLTQVWMCGRMETDTDDGTRLLDATSYDPIQRIRRCDYNETLFDLYQDIIACEQVQTTFMVLLTLMMVFVVAPILVLVVLFLGFPLVGYHKLTTRIVSETQLCRIQLLVVIGSAVTGWCLYYILVVLSSLNCF